MTQLFNPVLQRPNPVAQPFNPVPLLKWTSAVLAGMVIAGVCFVAGLLRAQETLPAAVAPIVVEADDAIIIEGITCVGVEWSGAIQCGAGTQLIRARRGNAILWTRSTTPVPNLSRGDRGRWVTLDPERPFKQAKR